MTAPPSSSSSSTTNVGGLNPPRLQPRPASSLLTSASASASTPAPRKFVKVKGRREPRPGATKEIKANPQPIAQQAVVSVNALATPNLMRDRLSKQSQGMALEASSEGADGSVGFLPNGPAPVYDIGIREPVFCSKSTKLVGGLGLLARPQRTGESPDVLWSSWNGLPDPDNARFIGVAVLGVNQSNPATRSATNNFPAAPQGTFTVAVGTEAVHFGDPLMWVPPEVARGTDNLPRPGTFRRGVAEGKFVATFAPMEYRTHGSVNWYRNVASHVMGGFKPNPEQNPRFARYVALGHAQQELRAVVADNVRNGAADRLQKAVAALVERLCTTVLPEGAMDEYNHYIRDAPAKRAEAALREFQAAQSGKDFKYVGTPGAATAATSTGGSGGGDGGAAFKPQATAQTLALVSNTLRWMELRKEAECMGHHQFFLERHCGTALATGRLAEVDVFIGGALPS